MMSLECSICYEKLNFLKSLSCNHYFCLQCLNKWKKKNSELFEEISCPVDRTVTVLGQNGENGLRTYFGCTNLTCEDCSEENSIPKCWWCKNCEKTICSTCAMTKHRNHVCSSWSDYEMVKEIKKTFLPYIVNTKQLDEQIESFCAQLEKSLKSRYFYNVECQKYLATISDVFGDIPSSTEAISTKNIEKALSTISKFINIRNLNNFHPNVELLKNLPEICQLPNTLNFPTIMDIVDEAFGNETHNNIHKINSLDAEIMKVYKVRNVAHLGNVIAICVIQNGFLTLDNSYTLRKIDDEGEVIIRWQCDFLTRTPLSCIPSLLYNELRSSFFINRETNDSQYYSVLQEYSLSTFKRMRFLALPVCRSFIAQPTGFIGSRFIAELSDGRIIYVNDEIWICPKFSLIDNNMNQWSIVWKFLTVETFSSTNLIKRSLDENRLYIQSSSKIYVFLITPTSTNLVSIINKDPEIKICVVLKQELFYMDEKSSTLRRFVKTEEALRDIPLEHLTLAGKEYALLPSLGGTKLFHINYDRNEIVTYLTN